MLHIYSLLEHLAQELYTVESNFDEIDYKRKKKL